MTLSTLQPPFSAGGVPLTWRHFALTSLDFVKEKCRLEFLYLIYVCVHVGISVSICVLCLSI
jgi:hypothetical protein